MSYYIEVKLPGDFMRLNSVQPEPKLGTDGYWYLQVYGRYIDSAPDYEAHIFRWKPGMVAEPVALADATTARGSIGVHPTGAALFSWDGDGKFPRLMVQDFAFAPAPLDARVDTLAARVAELEQAATGAGLSARDREAIDRLATFLGLA